MQFPGKPKKLEKMTEKLILDHILTNLARFLGPKFLLQVLPLLVVRHCFKLSCYTIKIIFFRGFYLY